MVFTSTVFLFVFLPIVLLGNVLLKRNIALQNLFLLGMSLVFYAWGEPKYIVLMLFSCCINWAFGRIMGKVENPKGRFLCLIVGILFNVSLLFICKYLNWGIGIFNRIFSTTFHQFPLRLPIGISFYTFQALSYIMMLRSKP